MFNIGDFVTVKDDLILDKIYGTARFIGEMKGSMGNTYEILHIDEDGDFILSFDDFFYFNEKMLMNKNTLFIKYK
jgi:hypothetical protein